MMPEQSDMFSDDDYEERPMPREVIDTPEMKARIEKAKQRAKKRGGARGSTAKELLDMARGVDSRT